MRNFGVTNRPSDCYTVDLARLACRLTVCLAAALLLLPAHPLAQEPWSSREPRTSFVQAVVDDLRTRLAIENAVSVAIVPTNVRIASVAPLRGAALSFHLTIDSAFLDGLSDDELAAVVAHELGHVWVSTHHPYLQTERLANSIAMRVVSRGSLERVYEKLWGRDGRKGDLVQFLGPPTDVTHATARD
jgi:hypothetical protein